jgi:cytochrome b
MQQPEVQRNAATLSEPPDLWDPVVRLTHWLIAMTVIVNGLLTRGGSALHVGIGWTAAALLILRVGWGLFGTAEARFAAFPPNPVRAIRHLADLVAGRPRAYRSHNPAGAIMAYALWIALAIVVSTGLMMSRQSPFELARQEQILASGDWATLVSGDGEESGGGGEEGGAVRTLHGVAANAILILAGLHVVGVMVESRAMRRNLVPPMLFGRRRRDDSGMKGQR